MKARPLILILVGLLLLNALAMPLMAARYFFSIRALGGIQSQVAEINQRRNHVNALANEAMVYSRTNPAIDPILQKYNIKPSRAGGAQAAEAPAN